MATFCLPLMTAGAGMAFTVYSDLAAILLFPEHRPSAVFTLHSPQCLPVLLLSAVF